MSCMSLSTDKDVYFWHFQVPENGTSSAQIQNLKLLFHAKGWNAGGGSTQAVSLTAFSQFFFDPFPNIVDVKFSN